MPKGTHPSAREILNVQEVLLIYRSVGAVSAFKTTRQFRPCRREPLRKRNNSQRHYPSHTKTHILYNSGNRVPRTTSPAGTKYSFCATGRKPRGYRYRPRLTPRFTTPFALIYTAIIPRCLALCQHGIFTQDMLNSVSDYRANLCQKSPLKDRKIASAVCACLCSCVAKRLILLVLVCQPRS